MSRKILSSVSLCALTLSAPAWAIDPPAGDTVPVTASRTALETHKVGSSLSVVDAIDIKRNQSSFLKDALLDIPGVFINADRPGGQTSVQLRGSENGQVLWLIDGIKVSDPSLIASEYESAHLASADIDRIEVLRGNQSSLYGSDAIGGVINVITKRLDEDGLRVTGQLEAGSYGWVSGAASALAKAGQYDLRFTLTGSRAEGPSAADPDLGPADEDDPYWTIGASGRLGYDLSDHTRVEVFGFGTVSDTRVDGTGMDAGFTDSVERDEKMIAGRVTHSTLDDRLFIEAKAGRYDTDRTYRSSAYGDSNYVGDRHDIDLHARFDVTDMVGLVGGFSGQFEHAQSSSFPSKRNRTLAGFGEVAVTPLDEATLTGAVRVDNNDRFGTFTTYRFTGAYVVEEPLDDLDLKLRASYGTGAKAPSLYQLFDPYSGNPDLEAEKSRGFDVGVDATLDGLDALLSVTYFWTRIENEIDYEYPAGYIQRGETLNRGVEVALSFAPCDWLSVSQSYTFLQADDLDANKSLGKPRHIGTTSLTLTPIDKLETTVRARYRSANRTTANTADGFITFDLLASYEIIPGVEAYGRMVNVMNSEYQYNYGYSTYDRSGFAGLRVAFGAN